MGQLLDAREAYPAGEPKEEVLRRTVFCNRDTGTRNEAPDDCGSPCNIQSHDMPEALKVAVFTTSQKKSIIPFIFYISSQYFSDLWKWRLFIVPKSDPYLLALSACLRRVRAVIGSVESEQAEDRCHRAPSFYGM